MESSKEILATIAIQQWYRLFKNENRLKKLKCIRIQAFIRGYLARHHLSLQSDSLTKVPKKCIDDEKISECAAKIQTAWRCFKERDAYYKKCKNITMLQCVIRGFLKRKSYNIIKNNLAINRRECKASLTIQRVTRGMLHRARLHTQQESAVCLQGLWRGHRAYQNFNTALTACVIIQKRFRYYMVEGKYNAMRNGIILLQSHVRAHSVREEINAHHRASVKIQSVWRAYVRQLQYMRVRSSVIVIQSMNRMLLT